MIVIIVLCVIVIQYIDFLYLFTIIPTYFLNIFWKWIDWDGIPSFEPMLDSINSSMGENVAYTAYFLIALMPFVFLTILASVARKICNS